MSYPANVISASDMSRTYIRGVPGGYITRVAKLAGMKSQRFSTADCELVRSFFEDGCSPTACAKMLSEGAF